MLYTFSWTTDNLDTYGLHKWTCSLQSYNNPRDAVVEAGMWMELAYLHGLPLAVRLTTLDADADSPE